MKLDLNEERVRFESAGRCAGEYVLNDRYKPHFRSIYTPAGHNCTLVSPGDHRHHKGMMYALKCEDVNFWEEDPGSGHCGIQEILSTELIEGGLRQELLWREEGGGLQTYRETRTITCEAEDKAFVWTWHTQREALRDHQLVVSFWLLELEDGRKINYHGLGIRLPWIWCWNGKAFGTVESNGEAVEYKQASGSQVKQLGFSGLIDGYWERTWAAVSIEQEQDFGWFALREGFPYISVGPSILGGLDVAQGQISEESYRIRVEDRS